ncbi:MAG: class I SAM-dependent methyltransferase [Acidobacteria bacterium]|nr:class I SAM-dependent methyltransferase [Acidobacteriota bacterium]
MQRGIASRTADRVAQRRAAHQLLDVPPVFVDPLAFRILEPEDAERITTEPGMLDRVRAGGFLRAFLSVRSRFAEDVLATAASQGVTQYVLLGAGFDTFAYRNPFDAVHVFEIDHPATQAEKRRRVEARGIPVPSNVTYIAADLGEVSIREALAESSFDFTARAVFAWLGVVPYLELTAVEATLRAIASLPTGTSVAFDYGIPRSELSFLGRLAFDMIAQRVAAAGEPWKTFFHPAELQELLLDVGFHHIEDLSGDDINERYFAKRADGLHVGEGGHLVHAGV